MAELIPKTFCFGIILEWTFFPRRNASATSSKNDDGHNRLFIHFYYLYLDSATWTDLGD